MIDWFWQERPIGGKERRLCLIVDVSGDLWEKCDKFKQWNERDRDAYTKGLRGDAVRIGKLGEVAVGVLLKKDVDFTFRKGGDKTDFETCGLSIDAKTTTNSYKCLLTAISTHGYEMPWKDKDIFIVNRLYQDGSKPPASIQVVGFFYAEDVVNLPLVDGKGEKHKNKELLFIKSRPITELITLLRNCGADVVGPEQGETRDQKSTFEAMSVHWRR